MARAYRPIPIPAGVEVKPKPDCVVVKGKLGTLTVPLHSGLTAKVESGGFSVAAEPSVERAHAGSARAHVRNALTGVSEGYLKVLEVRGMGYRVQKTKEGVQINVGYSHPVVVAASPGVTLEVAQVPDPDDPKIQMSEISVRGPDRRVVGELAAEIRAIKPPDNYRGKGVRYRGERVVKKAGKRAVATQA
jgi:large subunit ribosomal protein L6